MPNKCAFLKVNDNTSPWLTAWDANRDTGSGEGAAVLHVPHWAMCCGIQSNGSDLSRIVTW